MQWIRIRALIIKEFLALLRDPRGRSILIGPPIVQLFLFSYAATLEVTNVDIMVLNRDAGSWGQELLHRIEGAPTFRTVSHAWRPDAVREAIDTQKAIAAVEIGPSFSRDIDSGLPTDIGVILDGRNSNASQIVAGYIDEIVAGLIADTPAGRRSASSAIDVVPRNWFRPPDLREFAMTPIRRSSAVLWRERPFRCG